MAWSRRRKWAAGCGALLGITALAVLAMYLVLDQPLPHGQPGAAADDLGHAIERAVDRDAWERTRALRWTFRGTREHLWDRDRWLSRVAWDDVVVLHAIGSPRGVAWVGGKRADAATTRTLVREAYDAFINDSFWLNPLVKLFDGGTSRSTQPLADGARGLLVRYGSGGNTPGDSYLWEVGADNRPRAVQMWVSILPVGGTRFTWDRYQQLATGAWVATSHAAGPLQVDLTEVAGAATLSELTGDEDPFAPLLALGGP